MLRSFEDVDKKLARIEFFHDCAKPLMGIELFVRLKRPCTPAELGHFRVMIEIINLHEGEPHPTLWIACRDSYGIAHGPETQTLVFGSKSLVWSRNPDDMIQSTIFSVGQLSADAFNAGGHVHKRGPYPTMASLEARTVWVFTTRPLFELTAGIGLGAGGYLLTAACTDDLEAEAQQPLAGWPEPLTEAELAIPWVRLREKREPGVPPWFWYRVWSLDFSKFTPEKMEG
jgi:hypothetical protein